MSGQPKSRRSPARASGAAAGFTLPEVMVGILVGMIGLIGTVAVQQVVLNASSHAGDSQVALRLATKALEEFNVRRTRATPFVDMLAAVADATWSNPVYVDVQGRRSANRSATNRWQLRTRVSDLGAGQPYNISVEVSYSLDTGTPKIVRLDAERRKTW